MHRLFYRLESAADLARDRREIPRPATIEDVVIRTNDQEVDRVLVELFCQPAFDVADGLALRLISERDQPHGEAIAQTRQPVLYHLRSRSASHDRETLALERIEWNFVTSRSGNRRLQAQRSGELRAILAEPTAFERALAIGHVHDESRVGRDHVGKPE